MPLLIRLGIAKDLWSLTFILIILFHILRTEVCLLIELQSFWQQGFLDLIITFWAWDCLLSYSTKSSTFKECFTLLKAFFFLRSSAKNYWWVALLLTHSRNSQNNSQSYSEKKLLCIVSDSFHKFFKIERIKGDPDNLLNSIFSLPLYQFIKQL